MEIQMWREILEPYALAVDELKVKFEHLIHAYRKAGLYSPIEVVDGRVKSIASILEKVQKKHISMDDIEKEIDDIAGIRIICQFVDDIYKVSDIIKKRTDMKVVEEQDYVRNTKASGYRSYHIVIRYRVETLHGQNIYQGSILNQGNGFVTHRRQNNTHNLRQNNAAHSLSVAHTQSMGSFILTFRNSTDTTAENFTEICAVVKYKGHNSRIKIA